MNDSKINILNESAFNLSDVDLVNANIDFITGKIENLVENLIDKYGVDIELFYYCQEENHNVLVIDDIKENLQLGIENEVIAEIAEFADANKMMTALTIDVDYIDKYEEHGFVINTNFGKIQETIVRYPNLDTQINESIMVFGSFTVAPVKEIKPKAHQIQSKQYMSGWYEKYIEILNSEEYKKRRKKEIESGFIIRNGKRKSKVSCAKVGIAIVGKAKVGDCDGCD